MTPPAYTVRPAVYAPAILSVIAVVAAGQESWWFLAALPSIWLGSVCAQPNLNLADGCLAYVAMVAGIAASVFHWLPGVAICAGAAAGYYASAVEKRIRMRRSSGA